MQLATPNIYRHFLGGVAECVWQRNLRKTKYLHSSRHLKFFEQNFLMVSLGLKQVVVTGLRASYFFELETGNVVFKNFFHNS